MNLGIKKYFDIRELVDKQTFDKFGERAWQFFDPRLLEVMLYLRKELAKPITANNWHIGGNLQQRGLRTNLSPLVKDKVGLYLSPHRQGMALDFDVKDMTAEQVRKFIVSCSFSIPHRIRLEHLMNGKPISWVHLDVFDYEKNPKIHLFNV